jgi:membrane protein
MKKLWNRIRVIGSLIGETYNELLDDKVYKMTAALSYYTLLSLSPLLLIAISIAGFLFGEEAARGQIVSELQNLIGRSGAEVVQSLLQNSSQEFTGIVTTIISLVVIFLGSVGVFVEMKESLNIIWGVEPKPGQPIKNLIKTRVGAFSMVLIICFLLLVSLVVSSVLSAVGNIIGDNYPAFLPFMEISNFIATLAIITVLFAFIFRYLPDAVIRWKYVWMGALITSILFSIGKYLIGLYLGNSSYSSTFGAAGSLVVFMIWLNYSSLILFFGAEFTQVYRKNHSNAPLRADDDGIIIPKVSQLIKSEVKKNKKEKMQ